MKLLVIATNLNREKFWFRWQYLKDCFEDIDVTILAPALYESGTKKGYTFGQKEVFEGKSYEEERFRVIPIKVNQDFMGDWNSPDIKRHIKEEKPDFIYYIGIHASRSLYQTISAGKRYGAKVCVFTMRGDLEKNNSLTIKQRALQILPNYLNKRNVKQSDAIFVHYPDAVMAFRKEGYKGPLYINTQIGVDTSFFCFTEEGRRRVRNELGLDNCFVFGGASRFNEEKGILDAIQALPKDPKIKYMILGSGTKEDIRKIKNTALKSGVEDQIVMPGLIDWDRLCDYLSAMDCAIHIPRRTKTWVETFSLALVQEMSIGLPVIGSRSGSVPYQIGDESLLIEEGNVAQIRKKMEFVMNNREVAYELGEKNRGRCISCFDSKRIAKCLGIVLHEIQDGNYNLAHIDTAEVWKDIDD